MHHLSPADELAEIRAEIARLKLREASLRAAFLKDPDKGTVGRWTRVLVEERCDRVFDPALLPPEVREDGRYWRIRQVQSVICTGTAPRALRPGWPIQRTAAAPAMH